MFSTVILYEPVYNIISLQQAIRRVWRLGQTDEVVVKALVYPGMEEFAWQVIAKGISWAMSVYGDFTASSLGKMEDQSLDLLAALTEQLRSEDEEPAQQRTDMDQFNLAGIVADEVEVIHGGEAEVPDGGDKTGDEADDEDAVEADAADEPLADQELAEVPAEFAGLPLFDYAGTSNGNGSSDTDDQAAETSAPMIPDAPAGEPVQLSLFA